MIADGTKLRPMLIFKRKTKLPGNFPNEVVIYWNEAGWMDEAGCKFWLRNVWQRRPGGQRRERSLLVWDSFSAHLTDSVTKDVKNCNTDVAVIPGDLTGMLQPLDVSLNKPFKDALRRQWMEWMADEKFELTAGGNIRAPPLTTHAMWVQKAWDEVKVPVIIKSFKKCCISNAMDGTEDDILWEESTDDPDDPAGDADEPDVSDPHDDQIDPADRMALFNSVHDVDDTAADGGASGEEEE